MLFALFVFIVMFLMIVYYSFRYGITPMPTNYKVRKAILNNIPQDFSGTIIDLGSGWGGVLFAIAKRYPSAQIIGYEISTIPFFLSFLQKKIRRIKNVKIYRKDFFKISLAHADLVYCYLYVKAMPQLEEKFKQELRNGKKVIANCFALPTHEVNKIIEINDLYQSKLYFYTF